MSRWLNTIKGGAYISITALRCPQRLWLVSVGWRGGCWAASFRWEGRMERTRLCAGRGRRPCTGNFPPPADFIKLRWKSGTTAVSNKILTVAGSGSENIWACLTDSRSRNWSWIILNLWENDKFLLLLTCHPALHHYSLCRWDSFILSFKTMKWTNPSRLSQIVLVAAPFVVVSKNTLMYVACAGRHSGVVVGTVYLTRSLG